MPVKTFTPEIVGNLSDGELKKNLQRIMRCPASEMSYREKATNSRSHWIS